MNKQIVEAMEMVLEHFKHLHSHAKQMFMESDNTADKDFWHEGKYYYYNVVSALEDEIDHLKVGNDES
jgi:hypothetical protein